MLRRVLRVLTLVVVELHAALHLIGAVDGLTGHDLDGRPTSVGEGLLWLVAGVLVAGAGWAFATDRDWWWAWCLLAAVASQTALATSWEQARFGTGANALLVVIAAYGFASRGPFGLRAEYRRRVSDSVAEVAGAEQDRLLTESDLVGIPSPVAAYVRLSGAVGRPRVTGFHAVMHGRIRSGRDAPWMPFVAEQVNTYTGSWRRLFSMDATMRGLPVDVLHVYDAGRATMRAKVCSMVNVLDASGPEMDRAESVTLVNDVCVLAPGVLPFAGADWEELDASRARATFHVAGHDVRVELVFGEDGTLVDFVSDDRLRADARGVAFTPQRWSTPVTSEGAFDGHRLARTGEARWHAPDPEGEFAYLEFVIDAVDQLEGGRPDPGPTTSPRPRQRNAQTRR